MNDPKAALAELHQEVVIGAAGPDKLAALSLHCGQRGGGRPYDLAAAIYAWAFLFLEGSEKPPDQYDPRLRLALDRGAQSPAASPAWRGTMWAVTEPASFVSHGDLAGVPSIKRRISRPRAANALAGHAAGLEERRDVPGLDRAGVGAERMASGAVRVLSGSDGALCAGRDQAARRVSTTGMPSDGTHVTFRRTTFTP